MKFYKILLRPNGAGGMTYPPNYQDGIGNFAVDHLYYREEGAGYLLLLIRDVDVPNIISQGVEEITEVEAESISVANEPETESVTDEAKIARLTIKSNLGQTFTPDELKAIDPDDSTPGIGKFKRLKDRIKEEKRIERLPPQARVP